MWAEEDHISEPSHAQLEVRLANSASEVDAAQALRYKVFYEEMGAHPTSEMQRLRRDFDEIDERSDHLIVHDPLHQDPGGSIVGTYRLIRGDRIARLDQFYSSSEYDLGPIARFPGAVLELGRSCVAPAYRCRSVMQLLWRGIADYVWANDIGLMFGCGSLPGADLDRHAETLSYLHAHHLAPEHLRVRARQDRYAPMALKDPASIDLKSALAGLPPLIKGYLRLGGMVGDGAVLDQDFNTTDICILVETSRITDKYARKFIRANTAESALAA
jgi:L-ornithine Nalpha-acyltransferase